MYMTTRFACTACREYLTLEQVGQAACCPRCGHLREPRAFTLDCERTVGHWRGIWPFRKWVPKDTRFEELQKENEKLKARLEQAA